MSRVSLIVAGFTLGTGPASAAPPNGVSFTGIIDATCSRSLQDGRLYTEHLHHLRAGQQVGVNVRSRDFSPVLEIARRGSERSPLAAIRGAPDARPWGVVLRAPEDGAYIFRISTASLNATGRYRLEINFSDRVDQIFPGEDRDLSRPRAGCAPLIMD